jgi:hypothetical protein
MANINRSSRKSGWWMTLFIFAPPTNMRRGPEYAAPLFPVHGEILRHFGMANKGMVRCAAMDF